MTLPGFSISANKNTTTKTDTMIPEHYLHIILGAMAGVPLGFIIAAGFASRKMRRISADEWLAARKFYMGDAGQ